MTARDYCNGHLVYFAGLCLRSEYATQGQLKDMAEAVKKTLKSALSAQAKRIADTEEQRSELYA